MIVTAGDGVSEGIAIDIGGADGRYCSGVFIDGKFHYPNQFRGIVHRGYRDGDRTRVGETAIGDAVSECTKSGGVIVEIGIGGKHQTGKLAKGEIELVVTAVPSAVAKVPPLGTAVT